MNKPKPEHGMTLVELVMAIALAGVLVAGLMTAYSSIVGRSADPMIRTQTVALAESFLEEALLKAFLDPTTATRCPAPPGTNRAVYDNVCDYHNYSSSTVLLPNGGSVAGLAGYSVSITVADISAGELDDIATNCALKVTVSVTNPLNETLAAVGYRTDYESTPSCS
jgi:MSHA pilin protein MshD